MERLLHYVWKYKLYDTTSLMTTDGIPLFILDPGIQNTDAGPDFFNAKIKINNTVWVGNVEIHDKASDWQAHHHDTDKAYDSVILHVIRIEDRTTHRLNGEVIPQLILPIPDSIRQHIDWLLARDVSIPCLPSIQEIDRIHLSSWMDALLSERLERKARDIFRLLKRYQGDWNEVSYILLTRSFGFGVNSDAFERLAKSLPLHYIQKQRTNISQIEALLFGQAGMLSEPIGCPYYQLLQREYAFLQYKFGLKPLDESTFKNLRIRPTSFPHIRIAQIAAIWHHHDTLFSHLISGRTPQEIKDYLRVRPSDYWTHHYHFRNASTPKDKTIGDNALNNLLINTVVPLLFAYGQVSRLPEYCTQAMRLLETIPPERNQIVTLFTRYGIPVHNACDTQSLIQLKREYCEKKKCLYCRIGFRLLKRCVHP